MYYRLSKQCSITTVLATVKTIVIGVFVQLRLVLGVVPLRTTVAPNPRKSIHVRPLVGVLVDLIAKVAILFILKQSSALITEVNSFSAGQLHLV